MDVTEMGRKSAQSVGWLVLDTGVIMFDFHWGGMNENEIEWLHKKPPAGIEMG